jgi:hypothetical protein
MRDYYRKPLLLTAVTSALLLSAAAGIYFGWRHEPSFYRQALAADIENQQRGSNQLLEQASALANDVRRQGNWQTLFTAEQVNGWLAVDLPRNHAQLLPSELREPRVALERGRILVACRRGTGSFANVVALELEPYLLGPNELAIRIHGARAGWLPLPLKPILKQVSAAMIEAEWPLRWDQAGGDPVAVITLSAERTDKKLLSVESLEVHDGELYVAGTTRSRGWPSEDPSLDQESSPSTLQARRTDDDARRE